jgi:hypothetical protein
VQTLETTAYVDLERNADQAVDNATLLHPKMPLADLVALLIQEAEPEFLETRGRMLLGLDYASRARKARPASGRKPAEER